MELRTKLRKRCNEFNIYVIVNAKYNDTNMMKSQMNRNLYIIITEAHNLKSNTAYR